MKSELVHAVMAAFEGHAPGSGSRDEALYHCADAGKMVGALRRFDAVARQQFSADRWANQYGADVVGAWRKRGLTRIEGNTKMLWTGDNP